MNVHATNESTALDPALAPRLTPIYCSQCGQSQGLGLTGFSACAEHRLAEYRAALASFDWQFEFRDEHARWAAGFNALSRLHRLQRELDPSGDIWLSFPGAHTHGAPRPRLAQEALQ